VLTHRLLGYVAVGISICEQIVYAAKKALISGQIRPGDPVVSEKSILVLVGPKKGKCSPSDVEMYRFRVVD